MKNSFRVAAHLIEEVASVFAQGQSLRASLDFEVVGQLERCLYDYPEPAVTANNTKKTSALFSGLALHDRAIGQNNLKRPH